MTKIWVDDERLMPVGYNYPSLTTNNTIFMIEQLAQFNLELLISLDHDAGKCAQDGGDYIKILDYLEKKASEDDKWRTYIQEKMSFRLHTANPVGRDNMRRIIQKNGWKEV